MVGGRLPERLPARRPTRATPTRLLRRYLDGPPGALASRPVERPEVYLCVRARRRRAASARNEAARAALARRAAGPRRAARTRAALPRGGSRSCSPRRSRCSAGSPTTSTASAPPRTSCSGSSAGPSAAALCEPRSTSASRRRRSWSSDEATSGLAYRPLEADLLRLVDARSSVGRAVAADRDRAGRLAPGLPVPRRAARGGAVPRPAGGAAVRAARGAAVPGRRRACTPATCRTRARCGSCGAGSSTPTTSTRRSPQGDHGPTAQRRLPAAGGARARGVPDRRASGRRCCAPRSRSCVAAASEAELEERVERLRREYAPVRAAPPARRPAARCSARTCPPSAPRVPDYDDYLTVEQFGAMVPVATHAVGSETGPYIGHTLSGSRQPVLFDPTEASRTSRAPATACWPGRSGRARRCCCS